MSSVAKSQELIVSSHHVRGVDKSDCTEFFFAKKYPGGPHHALDACGRVLL